MFAGNHQAIFRAIMGQHFVIMFQHDVALFSKRRRGFFLACFQVMGQLAHHLKTGEKKAAPTLTEQCNIVLEHYDEMLTHYGAENGLMVARKHIGWYSTGIFDSASYRQHINTLTTPESVKLAITDFYARSVDRLDAAHAPQALAA